MKDHQSKRYILLIKEFLGEKNITIFGPKQSSFFDRAEING